MALSCKITRTLLSLADLELIGTNGYEIEQDGLKPGNIVQRRDWAKSPFVAGAALLSSVDDIAQASISVEVKGTSAADCRTKVTTLFAAFTQMSFTLTFDLTGGATWAWYGYSADRTIDFSFPFYLGNIAVCQIDFPRQPTPQSGPW